MGLKSSSGCIEKAGEVKFIAKSYFESVFLETGGNRPTLEGVFFKQIYHEESIMLEEYFSLEEIKEVIWNSPGDKSPGPDEFNMNFYKRCWEFLKDDLFNFANIFFLKAILPRAVTSSFLTLIPQVDNP